MKRSNQLVSRFLQNGYSREVYKTEMTIDNN